MPIDFDKLPPIVRDFLLDPTEDEPAVFLDDDGNVIPPDPQDHADALAEVVRELAPAGGRPLVLVVLPGRPADKLPQ
jgi:hypothetical protein